MKWTEVVQDCSQAVELNPRYVKALFRRAKALEKLDNKKECLEGEILFSLLKTVQVELKMCDTFIYSWFCSLCVLQMSQRCVFLRLSRTNRACC